MFVHRVLKAIKENYKIHAWEHKVKMAGGFIAM